MAKVNTLRRQVCQVAPRVGSATIGSNASSTIRRPTAASATSPGAVRTSGSSDGVMFREFATTAKPSLRYASTTPAPIPWDALVMTATLNPCSLPIQKPLAGKLWSDLDDGPTAATTSQRSSLPARRLDQKAQ
jgi:hypothetical protein